jgi:hypothetical protein
MIEPSESYRYSLKKKFDTACKPEWNNLTKVQLYVILCRDFPEHSWTGYVHEMIFDFREYYPEYELVIS